MEIDEPLLVSRPLELDAPEGGSVLLVLDLNTLAWLAALDPVTKTVNPEEFANQVQVVVPWNGRPTWQRMSDEGH